MHDLEHALEAASIEAQDRLHERFGVLASLPRGRNAVESFEQRRDAIRHLLE
jgi:hypothetical protein